MMLYTYVIYYVINFILVSFRNCSWNINLPPPHPLTFIYISSIQLSQTEILKSVFCVHVQLLYPVTSVRAFVATWPQSRGCLDVHLKYATETQQRITCPVIRSLVWNRDDRRNESFTCVFWVVAKKIYGSCSISSFPHTAKIGKRVKLVTWLALQIWYIC